LQGTIPASIGNLTNLQQLQLGLNKLQGPLPTVMPPSLEILNLGDNLHNTNKFTGGIPAEWGSLTNLKELKMDTCGLDGASCRLSAYTKEAN